METKVKIDYICKESELLTMVEFGQKWNVKVSFNDGEFTPYEMTIIGEEKDVKAFLITIGYTTQTNLESEFKAIKC